MTPDALDRLRKRLRKAIDEHDIHQWMATTEDEARMLLDALDAREADAKDAARYRWMRDGGVDHDDLYWYDHGQWVTHMKALDYLDTAIDAAMRGGKT